MTAILHWQKQYFESGDIYTLRPMMIRDLSNVTGLDPSVISRATTNKYVDTPWGAIIPLRSLFSDTVNQTDDEPSETKQPDEDQEDNTAPPNTVDALTNRQIEGLISTIVDEEDKRHPLSDEKIRRLLADKGYDISRRTIAKYRDRQGILVARLRKSL